MEENKEIKIIPPAGYEIDKEDSTFECIKFKKKESLTYEDVARELFLLNTSYYIVSTGKITKAVSNAYYKDPNTAASKKQLEKLLAINKLMNVAKYLNGDWEPNWNDRGSKYYFVNNNKSIVIASSVYNSGVVYFKSEELAQQAIDIIGEDTIRLALSTDW